MVRDRDTAIKTAELLLQIKAIKLQPQDPFTWASGWSSPIYCDNRVTLSYHTIRNYLRENIADRIEDLYGKPDVIAGVATGAIRETIEETGVQDLDVTRYLGSTYHIFDWKENSKLKLTHWYIMSTTYGGLLMPQNNEGIDEAVWLSKEDAVDALKVSYENIKYLFPSDMLV